MTGNYGKCQTKPAWFGELSTVPGARPQAVPDRAVEPLTTSSTSSVSRQIVPSKLRIVSTAFLPIPHPLGPREAPPSNRKAREVLRRLRTAALGTGGHRHTGYTRARTLGTAAEAVLAAAAAHDFFVATPSAIVRTLSKNSPPVADLGG
jgi:hypothetical protein